MNRANFWTVIILILIGVGLVCVYKYNRLSNYDEEVTQAWTPLGGELKKRYDSVSRLIPEVNLYVGSQVSESANLGGAYKRFVEAKTFDQQIVAANGVEDAIQKMAQFLSERFPVIKEQHQFDVIMGLAQETGDQMAHMITAYNAAVDKYNEYARRFPADIVASLFGFPGAYQYFQEEK